MTKDNWIKALREWIKTQHGSAGWEQKLENFISQVEKDAIEKTNKRWRLRVNEAIKQQYLEGKYPKAWCEPNYTVAGVLSDLLEDTYKGEVGDLWEVGLPEDHPIFEDK